MTSLLTSVGVSMQVGHVKHHCSSQVGLSTHLQAVMFFCYVHNSKMVPIYIAGFNSIMLKDIPAKYAEPDHLSVDDDDDGDDDDDDDVDESAGNLANLWDPSWRNSMITASYGA